ncbi:MAG: HAD family phosphatase [Blastochloris sp.]|nr:HAD family phosphatase [Blastochloris sp.]
MSKPSSPTPLPALLLSTDFDGTLLDHSLPPPLAPEFFDWLENERRRRRVVWIINTGRDWESLHDELIQRQARIWPDWVVLVEREIHRIINQRQEPLPCWNRRCQETHDDLFHRAAPQLQQTRRDLAHFPDLQLITDIGSPLGLIAASPEQADEVQTALEPLLRAFPEMHSVRNSVYFRFAHIDFQKGSCLARIAQEEGIPPENCFAAGDHLNDLPMLDPRHAHQLCCPSNAVPAVQAQVRLHQGHVSRQSTHLGVVEALEQFFNFK